MQNSRSLLQAIGLNRLPALFSRPITGFAVSGRSSWSGGLSRLALGTCLLVSAGCAAPYLPPLETVSGPQDAEPPLTDVPVDRDQILDAHNRVRASVDVSPLAWSNQMATLATQWAVYLANDNNCTMQHRGMTGLPYGKNGYGENIFWSGPEVSTTGERFIAEVGPENVVNLWAQEAADYNYAGNLCASGKQCGHYTQLVWRDSRVVGCGASSCPDKGQIWVCNYDPPGNYVGRRPY